MKKSCDTCPAVCELRTMAQEVKSASIIAAAEQVVLNGERDDIHGRTDEIVLRQLGSEVLYEVLEMRLEEPSQREYRAALRARNETNRRTFSHKKKTSMTRTHGAEWASRAEELGKEMPELCRGPVRGVRIELSDDDSYASYVIPLPFGRVHCGSVLRDAAELHSELGELYRLADENNSP